MSLLVNKEGLGRYGVEGNVEWLVLHGIFSRRMPVAPLNGARVGGTKLGERKDTTNVSEFPESGTWRGVASTSPARLPQLAVAPRQQSRGLCPSPYQGSRAYSSMAPASGRAVWLKPGPATPPL